MLNQEFEKSQLQHLAGQLQNFGLNPLDWKLRPISNKKCCIQNRRDLNFMFLGTFVQKNAMGPKWESIQFLKV